MGWWCRLLLSFVLAGCDSVELEIVQNQRPLSGSCELSTAPSDPIAQGTFDLAIGDRDSYVLTPIVENRTGDPVTIDVVRVSLLWDDGSGLTPLSIRCDGGETCDEWELSACDETGACPTVPASATASFPVPILPRVVTAYFLEQMSAAVADGRTPPEFLLRPTIVLEGGELASEPFEMDVRVCLGCLVTFPPGTDDPSISGADCCGGGAPEPVCLLGQDGPIDCRHCIRSLPEICNFGRLSCGP